MAANGSAPVGTTAEIEIDAPPQVVWEVLTRFENWPNWNPDVPACSRGSYAEPCRRRSTNPSRKASSI